ncbi:MAG: CO dehydrogenase/acetyl-CoA synthase complex subunit epsilon [Thermoproteota archaeon]|nr:MAG: CO dehydrogenase/acetyl-CoA synthase complex subunit epsilon [Candidatus Korarchaeota archaeon]
MPRKSLTFKIGELKTDIATLKNLEISLGRVEEEWEEPLGPTPMPSITSLRRWDYKLLQRYKPFYLPFCDLCCLCTFGKCDLTKGKKGACGIKMDAQQSRIVLLACCIGAATHTGHAREIVEFLVERFGRDLPLDLGDQVDLEAPNIRLVTGIKPRTVGDLEDVLDYVEEQIAHLLASTHTGQEGDPIDFESKVFHAGMLDHVAMEVADIAQIAAFNFPKGDPNARLAQLGLGIVDINKPVILVIGHNVIPSIYIVDYLNETGLKDEVEVCGLCCTAHDITRYNDRAKIIGPISWELRFIRTGVPDVIVVDEQCIRTDVLDEAAKIHAPLIAASEKACRGLPDRTYDPVEEIVEDLVSGRQKGALILDMDKVGEVATKVAIRLAPERKKFKALPSTEEVIEEAKRCLQCGFCQKACPNSLPIPEAMAMAKEGDLSKLAELYDYCIACGRCESACPSKLNIITMMVKSSEKKVKNEIFKVRVGRGPILDTEIRDVGRSIVLGEIPGIIAFVGCANYADGGTELVEMAEEFLKRKYIVVASGCAAMTIGMYKNDEGKTLYELYPGNFDAGCLVNVGSCVSNPHISGAAIKIANIFAKRPLRANYMEIADYVLNRVGAVGIAWGAMSQKAASIASGFWRLGVPVIVGPHGAKYRRMLLGRKEKRENWYVYDARTGKKVYVGPVPEHLFYAAETKEEAMIMAAKLCMRANDTTKGRAIKLTHYIDLYKRFYGKMPDDIHLFVRRLADIPITMKDEILAELEKKGWKETEIPDPTLIEELVRVKEE